jgi:hypothetical protein
MAFDAGAPTTVRRTRPLQVVSRWSGRGVRLVFGSLAADPGRGVVRLKQAGGKPGFFTTPEGAGALRLVSHDSTYSWTFRSSHGARAFLRPGDDAYGHVPPSFEFLGRKLDPAKLGPIGSRGVAVPIDLPGGKTFRPAVVLVEQTPARHGSFGNGWKVDGYLPGFLTPRLAAELKPGKHRGLWPQTSQGLLQQPLRGPEGQNYAIDVKGQRLVRVGGTPASTLKWLTLGECTTWPGSTGTSYRACGYSIRLRRAHAAATTILRRPLNTFESDSVWTFLQRSPNGRWLLLEEANETCSPYTLAEFLPARGGQLALGFPRSNTSSEALGWLPDNTALVAGQPQACGGNGPEGIYQVRPGTGSAPPAHQLVFAGNAFVATTWGFGR